MLGSAAFLIVNLLLWIVILAWIGIAERRGRQSFTSLNRGVKYRRMTTKVALKRIAKLGR